MPLAYFRFELLHVLQMEGILLLQLSLAILLIFTCHTLLRLAIGTRILPRGFLILALHAFLEVPFPHTFALALVL